MGTFRSMNVVSKIFFVVQLLSNIFRPYVLKLPQDAGERLILSKKCILKIEFPLLTLSQCIYSPLTRTILNAHDDALLNHLYDDNQKIEPEWYCPIIPMVLVNGAEGIGTGWSTKIPNYDVREIVANIRRMLDGLDPLPMVSLKKRILFEHVG